MTINSETAIICVVVIIMGWIIVTIIRQLMEK